MSPLTAYCLILIIIFFQSITSYYLVRGEEPKYTLEELEYERYFQHYYEHMGEETCPYVSSSEAYKPYKPTLMLCRTTTPTPTPTPTLNKTPKIDTTFDEPQIVTIEHYNFPIIILTADWIYYLVHIVLICIQRICIACSFVILLIITSTPCIILLYNLFVSYTF
jgi:hypothetical protein